MPSPDEAQVIDQVMTWFLDTVRIEELKVCISILIDQLKKAGFVDIDVERMVGNNPKVNYGHLGYCFITARKP